ncbi:MAG: DEAD/DEAH box helicase [Gemmatimonadaceae bacterium]|nr:DEAD/DEAH box helicase [Gemmatimonadaceae bacterium]
MALPPDIVRQFPPQIRERGDRYFHAGRVTLTELLPDRIEARVRGTDDYRVRIRPTQAGGLAVDCSCLYGRDHGWCKHVWATLLEADAAGLLPGARHDDEEASAREDGTWQTQVRRLGDLLDPALPTPDESGGRWPATRRIVYILDVHASSYRSDGLVVEVAQQRMRANGDWSPPVPLRVNPATWLNAPDVLDREVAQMLLGTRPADGSAPGTMGTRRYIVRAAAFDTTLRRMVETGRARLRVLPDAEPATVAWDPGEPWRFRLRVVPQGRGRRMAYVLDGAFARGEEVVPVHEPAVLMRGGLFVTHDCIHRFVDAHVFDVAYALRTAVSVRVPRREAVSLVAELFRLPQRIDIEIPPDLGLTHVHEPPVPCLTVREIVLPGGQRRVEGLLAFAYGSTSVPWTSAAQSSLDPTTLHAYVRDDAAEARAQEQLVATGFRMDVDETTQERTWRIAPTRSERAMRILTREGWRLDVEGRLLRDVGEVDLRLSTGIDWFELEGEVTFGEQRARLPELLAAVRRGDHRVALADGSLGMVPDELFDRLAVLTATGTAQGGHVRYRRAQAAVLDALLATMPAVRVDEAFERVREALHRFSGVAPANAPPSFTGVLREYQREGLGWLHFLREFGLGGCLADDMGLGKTVQALALLDQRRLDGAGPSLVVVPSSLVFNWEQEARRFAPELSVHVHAGPARRRALARAAGHHVMLTTYGTLRRDARELMDIEFDYVILDEAQAIKNPETDAAKAARLLRARHRLAMSGTPIENRLAELWSLLEFLNPGMLGTAAAFARLTRPADDGDADALRRARESRELLARAVRPYVLRRTKESVARDLPDKVEQTLYVDLGETERKRYDELRNHYRAQLFLRVDDDGLPARVHVLEALLRLRQAACHPGLMAPDLVGASSSKLEVLESHVREAVAEGHKVLVFSQFTSFLAIVRRALDAAGIVYEYLDGQTRDRAARVTRFQEDASCPVFLISLKAGGLGLNLTAADYVILLDPWWNPAVESQAIDRAHRIGQSRAVFATRLIARDTVEEKVVQLQASKRDLAEAIIRADAGPVSSLTREDLELLLS